MALFSPLSIAPMIDWTNTYFRVFMRLLAPQALVYTEMQTTGALLHNPLRCLSFDPFEHPIALQIGGSNLNDLVRAALLAEEYGYLEVNLNLGCPSDRVQAGRMGACLMTDGSHVAACIAAMKRAVKIPITAKTRIGVDHQDSYEFFANFAKELINAGADKLIVHARKAWLNGLSPKQNRTVPPLHYDYVYRLKDEFPQLPIVINGNINTLEEVKGHLTIVDGVMIGRLACQNPYAIAELHHELYPKIRLPTRREVVEAYLHYVTALPNSRVPLSFLLKPLYTLAHGLPFSKDWKACLMKIQQSQASILMLLEDTGFFTTP